MISLLTPAGTRSDWKNDVTESTDAQFRDACADRFLSIPEDNPVRRAISCGLNSLTIAQCLPTAGPSSHRVEPLRWRRYVPPKRRLTPHIHGAKSGKTAFFIVTTVKVSNLIRYLPGRGLTKLENHCSNAYRHYGLPAQVWTVQANPTVRLSACMAPNLQEGGRQHLPPKGQ
jgi:hypothetical protein